jgi:hypothetical protein
VPGPAHGYSGTPLATKLGIKPGHRLMLLNAPGDLALDLPDGVQVVRQARGKADVIVSFHAGRAAFERRLPKLRACMEPAAGLWIAWPKKAAKAPTDLDENVVRAAGLANALVDNKVAANDETWSGLRLVIRLKDRGAR